MTLNKSEPPGRLARLRFGISYGSVVQALHVVLT